MNGSPSPVILAGLALRDFFAAQILAGPASSVLLGAPGSVVDDQIRLLAARAYQVADAMVAARQMPETIHPQKLQALKLKLSEALELLPAGQDVADVSRDTDVDEDAQEVIDGVRAARSAIEDAQKLLDA